MSTFLPRDVQFISSLVQIYRQMHRIIILSFLLHIYYCRKRSIFSSIGILYYGLCENCIQNKDSTILLLNFSVSFLPPCFSWFFFSLSIFFFLCLLTSSSKRQPFDQPINNVVYDSIQDQEVHHRDYRPYYCQSLALAPPTSYYSQFNFELAAASSMKQ